jgi:hypothetical protein
LRQIATGAAGLHDQAVGFQRNSVGGGGGIFGFAANTLAGPVHVADQGAEIRLQKVDCFAGAVDLSWLALNLDGLPLDGRIDAGVRLPPLRFA